MAEKKYTVYITKQKDLNIRDFTDCYILYLPTDASSEGKLKFLKGNNVTDIQLGENFNFLKDKLLEDGSLNLDRLTDKGTVNIKLTLAQINQSITAATKHVPEKPWDDYLNTISIISQKVQDTFNFKNNRESFQAMKDKSDFSGLFRRLFSETIGPFIYADKKKQFIDDWNLAGVSSSAAKKEVNRVTRSVSTAQGIAPPDTKKPLIKRPSLLENISPLRFLNPINYLKAATRLFTTSVNIIMTGVTAISPSLDSPQPLKALAYAGVGVFAALRIGLNVITAPLHIITNLDKAPPFRALDNYFSGVPATVSNQISKASTAISEQKKDFMQKPLLSSAAKTAQKLSNGDVRASQVSIEQRKSTVTVEPAPSAPDAKAHVTFSSGFPSIEAVTTESFKENKNDGEKVEATKDKDRESTKDKDRDSTIEMRP